MNLLFLILFQINNPSHIPNPDTRIIKINIGITNTVSFVEKGMPNKNIARIKRD
jgi:hypothetical protein